jgi:2-methylcitrate dehydratase PrpD
MHRHGMLSRRRLLQSASAAAVMAAVPAGIAAAASDTGTGANASITAQLAGYMVAARGNALPPAVLVACKQRILDTFAAMVSGCRLRPGLLATEYVRELGGTSQASVIGTGIRTTEINAAFANGMCAHAAETDDFEPVTKAHPGCSTVPAALAVAEKEGRSGQEFVRAVALGYDIGCRLLMALGPDLVRATHRGAEGTASTFCALGAAASLARLDETGMRYAISYSAQQDSGLWSWVKDKDHIEKAFDFGGMGARNGVMSVTMVQAGMTGVFDVLDGTHNLLIALSTDPKPQEMVNGLGNHFFVADSAIKKFAVGYPIQAPLDAFLTLRKQENLTPSNVRSILVKLPPDTIGIVGDSAMADVNCAHIIAIALLKGTVTFADSNDVALMRDPNVLQQRAKVTVTADPALADPAAPRGAIVEVTLTDGRKVSHHTKFPPGTKENPLSTVDVNEKARELMAPVLGEKKTERLIAQLSDLENLRDIRELRPLFTV